MSRLLPLLALLSLLGCAPTKHTATAPRRWIRYYHHEQRRQERARRRLIKSNITWSKL